MIDGIPRTEELALAGRLPIVVGGQRVELRTLNLEESERWLEQLSSAAAQAAQDVQAIDEPGPGALLVAVAKLPIPTMLEAVRAYDVDGRLPANLKQRFTAAEVYAALKTMVRAEVPFLEDARSAAEAFGPQLRAMAASVLWTLFRQENSTSGPSLSGDSTPADSEEDSAKSSSSSSGSTATDEPAAKPMSKTRARSSR